MLKLNYLLRKTDGTFITYAVLGFFVLLQLTENKTQKRVCSDRAKGKNQPGALGAAEKVGRVRQTGCLNEADAVVVLKASRSA